MSTTGSGTALEFRREIQDLIRLRVGDAIQVVLEEELAEALECGRYERSDGRRDYRKAPRHGR